MPKVKILFVVGTRPEAIKCVPLLKKIDTDFFVPHVYVSSQHPTSVEIDKNLGIISISKAVEYPRRLSCALSMLVSEIRHIISSIEPAIIICVGDTSTALATARAGFLEGRNVCHIEAGMRTQRWRHPFPEELFRVEISRLANFHVAVNAHDARNLLNELPSQHSKIFILNSPIYDALVSIDFGSVAERPYIVVHLHRRELRKNLLLNIANKFYSEFGVSHDIIMIRNRRFDDYDLFEALPPMRFMGSIRHIDFIKLIGRSDLVITDSGTVQEECYGLDLKTVIFRDFTERPYLVDNKKIFQSGLDVTNAVKIAKCLIGNCDRDFPVRIAVRDSLRGGSENFCSLLKSLSFGGPHQEPFSVSHF